MSEPDSRPFEPVAYDLAPQFTVPPATPQVPVANPEGYVQGTADPGARPDQVPETQQYQAYTPHVPVADSYAGQAPYPVSAFPANASTSAPAYGHPAPPPVYAARPAYAPMPTKSRLPLIIGVLGVVVVLGCGIGIWSFVRILNTPTITVAVPSTVGEYAQVDDPELRSAASGIDDQLRTETRATNSVSAFYRRAGAPAELVAIVAATAGTISPTTDLDEAFDGMTGSGMTVTAVSDYPAGTLGGKVRCGNGETGGQKVAVCGWADSGSIGIGLFFASSASQAAPLFLQFREAVETKS